MGLLRNEERKLGADDTEQEGQLTDSTTTSSCARAEIFETAESATEDEQGAVAAAAVLLRCELAAAGGRDVFARRAGHSSAARLSPEPLAQAKPAKAAEETCEADGLFDWGTLDQNEAKPHRDFALFDWGNLEQNDATLGVEDAMEGLVTLATNVADSVAGAVAAVGDAAAAALGENASMAGAVLALGETANAARHGGALPSMACPDNLTLSIPLHPPLVGAVEAGGNELARELEEVRRELAAVRQELAEQRQRHQQAAEAGHQPPAPAERKGEREEDREKERVEGGAEEREKEKAEGGAGARTRTASRAMSRGTLLRRHAATGGAKHSALVPQVPQRSAPGKPHQQGLSALAHGGGFRIALLANGSEGDLRPLVALAKTLAEEKGHRVRVLTNANLVHLPLKHGIDTVPTFADTKAVMQRCGGLRGDFVETVVKPTRAAERWLKEHEGEYMPAADALEDFAPHAIIAGAQVTGVCMRYAAFHDVTIMGVYLHRPWVESQLFNFLSDLEPPRPSFYAVSEVVDPKPVPHPRTMRTSAWVLNENPEPEDLLPGGSFFELKEFLDQGPSPVAVGWGSMLAANLPPAEMLELALCALMQVGRRGVIIGGYAELDRVAVVAKDGRLPTRGFDGGKLAAFAKEQVCFVPSVPHRWLFPRCCCVIHHGGIGTLHAALRASRPSVVTPICADQFDHAEAVTNQHMGIGFSKALPEISPRELANAVRVALKPATTAAVKSLGRRLVREEGQGATRAAEMIDGFLRGKIKLSKNGQWVKRVNAKKADEEAA